ncbi:hypothetical protein GCM10025792_24620 [Pseudonocardia tropica]
MIVSSLVAITESETGRAPGGPLHPPGAPGRTGTPIGRVRRRTGYPVRRAALRRPAVRGSRMAPPQWFEQRAVDHLLTTETGGGTPIDASVEVVGTFEYDAGDVPRTGRCDPPPDR